MITGSLLGRPVAGAHFLAALVVCLTGSSAAAAAGKPHVARDETADRVAIE